MDRELLAQYRKFWDLLPKSVEVNLKFAHHVSHGEPIHQHFFFGEYSEPILRWIVVSALYRNANPDAERAIMGRYYEFVAGPFRDSSPQWYQLESYKGINGEKLHSWLKRNGAQWFRKEQKKEENQKKQFCDLIEIKHSASLLGVDDDHSLPDEESQRARELLSRAWSSLSEKDQEVLILLLLDKVHWSEAWESLNLYIDPEGGRDVLSQWSPKRKQDAMAVLKKRAIQHLTAKYNKLMNNGIKK